MSDWIIYLILFVMGGVLTLLEETAKNVVIVFNRKVFKLNIFLLCLLLLFA